MKTIQRPGSTCCSLDSAQQPTRFLGGGSPRSLSRTSLFLLLGPLGLHGHRLSFTSMSQEPLKIVCHPRVLSRRTAGTKDPQPECAVGCTAEGKVTEWRYHHGNAPSDGRIKEVRKEASIVDQSIIKYHSLFITM